MVLSANYPQTYPQQLWTTKNPFVLAEITPARYIKEPLNKSLAGATGALRDEMRERRRREWLIPFARSLTKQIARKAPSHGVAAKSGGDR
jgi:hypothetical protein